MAALLLLVLAPVYVLTSLGPSQSADAVASGLTAWSLARSGDPWLDELGNFNMWLVPGVDDHLVSNRFPGAGLLAVPAHAVLGSADAPAVLPGNVTAAVAAATGMAVLFLLLAPVTGRRRAVLASLFVALATPTWSVSADALWPHAPGQALLLAAVLALRNRWYPAYLPLLLMATLTRPVLVLLGAVLVLHHLRRSERVPAAVAAVSVVIAVGGLVGWNLLVFGRISLTGGYGNIRDGHALPLLGELVELPAAVLSPLRGVLVVTPLVLLALLGLRRTWSQVPDHFRVAAVAGALVLLATFQLAPADGGDGYYGYRLPIEGLTLLAPALVVTLGAWASTARRRAGAAATATWSVATTAAGAVLYRPTPEPFDPWRELDLARLIRDEGFGAVSAVGLLAAAGAWALVLLSRPRRPDRAVLRL